MFEKFKKHYVIVENHQTKPRANSILELPEELVNYLKSYADHFADPDSALRRLAKDFSVHEPEEDSVSVGVSSPTCECKENKDVSIEVPLPEEDLILSTGQRIFRRKLRILLGSFYKLLSIKNNNYGNASFTPLRIFDKSGVDSKLSRLDEKLARIKASDKLRKSDWCDLVGYLLLEGIEHDWLNLDDLLN